MTILIGVRPHHKLVLHDLLGQLCPIGADGCVTIHDEDVVRILFHNEFKGSLIAVGGGINIGGRADIFKADLPSDHGAASIVAQHVEAAAGDKPYDRSLSGRKFIQGSNAGIEASH